MTGFEYDHEHILIDTRDIARRLYGGELSDNTDTVSLLVGHLTTVELEQDGSVWLRQWESDHGLNSERRIASIGVMLANWTIAEIFEGIADSYRKRQV